MRFFIWSFEHEAWWKPARKGYTEQRDKAGRYSLEEAVEICCAANAHSIEEAMVPED